MTILSLDGHIADLQRFYLSKPQPVPSGRAAGFDIELGTDLRTETSTIRNLTIYFERLYEEMSDLVKTKRWVQKGHLSAPKSVEENACEVLLSLVGTIVPGVALVGELTEKLGHHGPHLLHMLKEFSELGLHAKHLSSAHSESCYEAAPEFRGKQLKVIFYQLAGILTYEFRHELSTLTEEECFQVAFEHYLRIKTYLTSIGKGEIRSVAELYKNILGLLDPHPLEAITKLINDYITNREQRIWRSNDTRREIYLNKFLNNCNNIAPEEHIHELSSNIFFKNDWIFWDNQPKKIADLDKELSLSNSYICQLVASKDYVLQSDCQVVEDELLVFNNPFWSTYLAPHTSMQDTCKKVILVLIRHLTLVIVNNERNLEENKQTASLISYLISPETWSLKKEVVVLGRKIEELEKVVTVLKEQVEQMRVSTPNNQIIVRV